MFDPIATGFLSSFQKAVRVGVRRGGCSGAFVRRLALWVVVTALILLPRSAGAATWNGTGLASSWNNWFAWWATVPNSAGAVATFANNGTVGTVNVNGTFTIGTLQFQSTSRDYVLSGGKLIFRVNSGDARLEMKNGRAVTINSALDLSNKLVVNHTGSKLLTLAGVIGGTNTNNSMTKTGGGTMLLSGSNTYAGETIINGGVVIVANNKALGGTNRGTTVNTNAELHLSNNITITNEALTLNGMGIGGNGALRNMSGTNTLTGPITLGSTAKISSTTGLLTLSGNINPANNVLTLNGAGNTLISGNITNSTANILKEGAGTLTLAGTNTHTGVTEVNSGVLLLTNGSAIANTAAVDLGDVAGATLVVATSETIGSLRGGGSAGGNVSITTGQTLTVNESGDETFSGVISNAGSLAKSGAGTLHLTASNSYTGATTISGGTLALATNTAVAGTSGIFISNATLAYDGGAATIGKNVTVTAGTGTLRNSGGGTLTLSGEITNAGTTVKFGQGEFNITGKITGTNANSHLVVDSATVTLANSNNYNGTTYIRNAGVLNANVAGALPTNTRSAVVMDDTGSGGSKLSLGASQQIASLSGTNSSSVVLGSNRLTIGTGAGTTVFSGVISGTGGITKDGNSVQILTGSNSYTGGTMISGGTLQIGNGSPGASIGASAAITNNAALVYNVGAGNSTISAQMTGTGSLTQQSVGGVLNITASNSYSGGTFITGGKVSVTQSNGLGTGQVKLTGSSTNAVSLSYAPTNSTMNVGAVTLDGYATLSLQPNSKIQSSGAVSINSTNNYINLSGNTWNTGTNILVSGTSLGFGSGASIFLTGSTVNNANLSLGSSVSVGRTTYTFNSNSTSLYVVATGNHFDVLWTGAENNTWNTNATNWRQTTMGTNPVAPDINFLSHDNVYFGTAAASGGPITVAAGGVHASSIYVTNTNGLVTLQGGSIEADDFTKTGAGSLTIKSNLELVDHEMDDSAIFKNEGSGAVRIEGVFSGHAHLIQSGAGTLTLAASNSYSGNTTVTAGTLVLATNRALGTGALLVNGGTVDTATFSQVITNSVTLSNGSIIGSGTITANGYLVHNGGISANLAGSNGLNKMGAGTVVLSGSNSYTGANQINGGVLQISSDANLGNATNGIQFNNGTLRTTANVTNSRSITLVAGGSIETVTNTTTLAGPITGGGSLAKTGSGTLVLTGTNTYSGGTLVSAGKVVGTTTALQGVITNNAAVVFDQTTNGTYAGIMSGTGSLEKSGTGTVTLSGANTYSGGTLVSAGRLIGTTTSLKGAITNNSSVEFSQTASGTYAGAMSGTGTLVKSGTGTVTLSGANTYSGGTLVSGGRLVGSTLSLQGNITNNATLAFNQTTNGTYSGVISGTGVLEKLGTGSVTLGGATSNTYTGNTIVKDGTLVLAKTGGATAISSTNTSAGLQIDTDGKVLLGASNQINNTTGLKLNGGTFMTGTSSTGYSEQLGTLTLSADSTIDFGSWAGGAGSRNLNFADSSGVSWSGALVISNWAWGAGDYGAYGRLFFGSNASALTEDQLEQISFNLGGTLYGAKILSTGEVIPDMPPIPEPRVYAAFAALLAGIIFYERRRVLAALKKTFAGAQKDASRNA